MVSHDSNKKVTKALAFRSPGLPFPTHLTLIKSVFLVLEGLVSALLLLYHDGVARASHYLINHRLSCLRLLPFHPAGMRMNCSFVGEGMLPCNKAGKRGGESLSLRLTFEEDVIYQHHNVVALEFLDQVYNLAVGLVGHIVINLLLSHFRVPEVGRESVCHVERLHGTQEVVPNMYYWVCKKGTAQAHLEAISKLTEPLQQMLEALVELSLLALLEAEAQALHDLCLTVRSSPHREHGQAHEHTHGGEEDILIRGFRSQGPVETEGKVLTSGNYLSTHRGRLDLLLPQQTGVCHPKAEEQQA